MRMMLVGAGAVGECILKVLKKRDGKGEWLPYVLITDYDGKRAEEVRTHLAADGECRISFACAQAGFQNSVFCRQRCAGLKRRNDCRAGRRDRPCGSHARKKIK